MISRASASVRRLPPVRMPMRSSSGFGPRLTASTSMPFFVQGKNQNGGSRASRINQETAQEDNIAFSLDTESYASEIRRVSKRIGQVSTSEGWKLVDVMPSVTSFAHDVEVIQKKYDISSAAGPTKTIRQLRMKSELQDLLSLRMAQLSDAVVKAFESPQLFNKNSMSAGRSSTSIGFCRPSTASASMNRNASGVISSLVQPVKATPGGLSSAAIRIADLVKKCDAVSLTFQPQGPQASASVTSKRAQRRCTNCDSIKTKKRELKKQRNHLQAELDKALSNVDRFRTLYEGSVGMKPISGSTDHYSSSPFLNDGGASTVMPSMEGDSEALLKARKKVEDLQIQVGELKASLGSRDRELSNLRSELGSLRDGQTTDTLDKLNADVETMKVLLRKREKELHEVETVKSHQAAELSQIRVDRDHLREERDYQLRDIAERERRLEVKLRGAEKLDAEERARKLRERDDKQRTEQLKKEESDRSARIAQLVQQEWRITETIAKLESDIGRRQDAFYDRSAKDLEKGREELAKKRVVFEKEKERFDKYKAEKDVEMEELRQDLEGKMSFVADSTTDADKKREMANKMVLDSEQEIRSLRSARDTYKVQLDNSAAEIRTMRGNYEELMFRSQGLEKEVRDLTSALEYATGIQANASETMAEHQQEVERVREQLKLKDFEVVKIKQGFAQRASELEKEEANLRDRLELVRQKETELEQTSHLVSVEKAGRINELAGELKRKDTVLLWKDREILEMSRAMEKLQTTIKEQDVRAVDLQRKLFQLDKRLNQSEGHLVDAIYGDRERVRISESTDARGLAHAETLKAMNDTIVQEKRIMQMKLKRMTDRCEELEKKVEKKAKRKQATRPHTAMSTRSRFAF